MSHPDQEVVTIADIRRAGFCVSGARRWFEAHRLDFRLFLAEGIPAAALLATGDSLAHKVVEKKREREHG